MTDLATHLERYLGKDPGTLLFFAVGATVILPLGARFAGNIPLARRLDLIPQFVFGTLALILAFARDSTFFYADFVNRTTGLAPQLSSRILFGAVGLFLYFRTIRSLVLRDFDRPNDEDDYTP